MTGILLRALWVVIVIGVGYSVSAIAWTRLNERFSLLEKLALSYLVGTFGATVMLAVFSSIHLPFKRGYMILGSLMIILFSAILGKRERCCVKDKVPSEKITIFEKLLMLGIVFQGAYTIFRTFIKPIESYDAIAIYAIKAKIFFTELGIPADFFSRFKGIVPHIEYPLHIPLLETSFYVVTGTLDDCLVKIIFPLFYFSIAAILFTTMKSVLPRIWAITIAFLFMTIPVVSDYATNGYADLAFAAYISAAFFYMYKWTRSNESGLLWISGILLLCGVWTKSEGIIFPFIFICAGGICAARDRDLKKRAFIYYAASLVIAMAIYFMIKKAYGIETNDDFKTPGLFAPERIIGNLSRIPLILYEYQIQFFGPKKWNIAWILFLIGVVMNFRRLLSDRLILTTSMIFLSFAAYTFIYIVTPQNIQWHLSTTVSRLFIHFIPVVMLWIGLAAKEMDLA